MGAIHDLEAAAGAFGLDSADSSRWSLQRVPREAPASSSRYGRIMGDITVGRLPDDGVRADVHGGATDKVARVIDVEPVIAIDKLNGAGPTTAAAVRYQRRDSPPGPRWKSGVP